MKRVLVVLLCLSQTGCIFAARQIYKEVKGDDTGKSSGNVTEVSGNASGVVFKVTGAANPDPKADQYCTALGKTAQQSHADLAPDNSYTTYYYDCR